MNEHTEVKQTYINHHYSYKKKKKQLETSHQIDHDISYTMHLS